METVKETPPQNLPVKDTTFCSLKLLVNFSKCFGAFPFQNTLANDGRNLKHSWFDKIHLWDFTLCASIVYIFVQCLYNAIESESQDGIKEESHSIGIALSYFIAGIRGIIQFILLHIFAPRLPKLFVALEEYHQEIGIANIIHEKRTFFSNRLSVLRMFFILIVWEILSFSSISSMNSPNLFLSGWPMITMFIFSNLWQEMPMNMFAKICMYLKKRLTEIRQAVIVARLQKDTQDVSETLEILRLQHVALARIVSQLEKCYGVQVAANIFFLLTEIVIHLYVFFVVTYCSNLALVTVSVYYFTMAVLLLAIVDRLQRTNYTICEEISEFRLHSAPKNLRLQIQLFSAQLAARPIVFSASGYFIINNTLVASILGAAATYLVVFIQFAPYLHDLLNNSTVSMLE